MAPRVHCTAIEDGEACRLRELPGFGYCMSHLPDELCDEAAKLGWVRCKAYLKSQDSPRYGLRCKRAEVNGLGFCQDHVPRTRWLVPKSRAQRAVVAKIHRAASAEGIDTTRVANPLQALLELADEALSFKNELARRVVALEENEWRYENVAGEQIRGDIILYERALDRTAKMLLMLARLGIEERLARVTERQALLVETAVEAALAEAGIPLEKQDKARAIIARHLRAVE